MSEARYCEVQVTCGSVEEAERIATELVERRLAACVQQVPIRSTYRWQGAIERDDEILLLVKTSRRSVPALVDSVVALHSYDVAAVTVVDIADGSADYLDWIDTETA